MRIKRAKQSEKGHHSASRLRPDIVTYTYLSEAAGLDGGDGTNED